MKKCVITYARNEVLLSFKEVVHVSVLSLESHLN